MDAKILTVHWHDESAPVYSLSYQPNASKQNSERLVSGGGDNNIRIWKLDHTEDGVKLEYLSTLAKHSQAVNVVRFDPTGEILATAGDDGMVLLWTKADSIVKEFGQDAEDLEDIKESWTLFKSFRSSSSEVYDLCWSPDSRFIITGSTDNIVRIYDVKLGTQVNSIAEHNHFVQGVAFDPRGEFIVSQSADRSIHVSTVKYDLDSKISMNTSSYYKITRAEIPTRVKGEEGYKLDFKHPKTMMLYHTENLESFFRRLSFSPDGLFLFTPSGVYKPNSTSNNSSAAVSITEETSSQTSNKEETINTVYIYSRHGLNKPPVAQIPNLKKPAIAISFSPIYYALPNNNKSVLNTPYKLIYAVLTQDSVIIFDTASMKPIGSVSGIHYRTLTDLAWNQDGLSLIISSADGFCSAIKFKRGVFGEALDGNYETLMKKGKEENSLFSSEKLKESTEVAEVSKKREIPEVFNLISGASVRKKPKNKPTTPSAVDAAAGAVQEAKEEIKPSTVGPIPADNGNETVQGKAFENGKPSIEVVTLSDDDDDIVM
ncbi:hypothetical protein WICPIJ_008848, partial [Wickerhamomyces pijperi]